MEGRQRELQEIVDHHTIDAVIQLIYWNAGTFRFQVAAKQPVFPVAPSVGVDELLLEACRRADEGARPWREKVCPKENCAQPAPLSAMRR